MNKMFVVMKREYLQAVRKKMFIIMTILFPFLMVAMMVVPSIVMAKGMGKKRVAVLDGTGKLEQAFSRPSEATPNKNAMRRGPELPTQITFEYVNTAGKGSDADAKPYLHRLTLDDEAANKLEGVFVIPANALNEDKAQLSYYSRSATDLFTQERVGRVANRSLQRLRLTANGADPAVLDDLLRDVPVKAVQISRSGEKKTGGELNFLMPFILGALLLIPSLIYGQETMRGIVQEKTDRVVEVLISSVSPMQLLTGKILGIAAVGLTQIVVWLGMIAIAGAYGATVLAAADVNIAQFVRPIIFLYFFIFFILAYMTYVCVYAVAGAVCNSEKEAQQFVMPVMLLMMIPWFLMMPISLNPDAPFAVGFSLSPVFGPITMFVRATATDPPAWHFLVSIAVSIATLVVLFWVTAKIFRVGILSYGKRPTIPELMRWIRVA